MEIGECRAGAIALIVVVSGAASGCGSVNPASAWLVAPKQPYVWQKTYGGDANDVGVALAETADGGFLIAGYTESEGAGGRDLWVIRTDADGEPSWTRTFGGPADDHAWDALSVEGGGFVVAGFTASFGAGGEDVWLLRLNESGDTLWTRTYGGPGDERAWAITSRGGGGGWVIAAQTRAEGSADIDQYLIAVDARGEVAWSTEHGGPGVDRALDVERTADGDFLFAGITSESPNSDPDAVLLRVSAAGQVMWERSYGGAKKDFAQALVASPDGGALLVGYSDGFGSADNDVWLVRTDASGRELWSRHLGERGDDRGAVGARLSGGGYVIAGHASSAAGDWDAYVVTVDEDGKAGWSDRFGGTGSDRAAAILEVGDGEFVLAGSITVVNDGAFDALLVKFRGGD